MSTKRTKEELATIFNQLADAVEDDEWGEKSTVAVTTLSSEHGVAEVVKGAELANKQYQDLEVLLIGPEVDSELEVEFVTDCEDEAHDKLEELLASGRADAGVTMHYNFPIGVSTVGRVVTPGRGKELILATSTGSADTDRVKAMVKNAVYGIIAAKSLGIEEPTVGILNVDGARQVEQALQELAANGYPINFAQSARADGGAVMRGNDLLVASADIMVTDTLTGNLLMKLFSAFTTGGTYEALGYGYGPGIGQDYEQIVNIVSRASGAPVISGAIRYAADVAQGDLLKVSKQEFKVAEEAGLEEILDSLESNQSSKVEEVSAPPQKTVTEEISGIDILVLDDAKFALWQEGIYAETGMGCSGPVVLIASEDQEAAERILKEEQFIN
ncbi:MAG: glycine/sarcosine/betaine reductase complex component C subunit alpha [Bacillota bacterium]